MAGWGHGAKRVRKQEAAVAALLSEPSIEQAATVVGISSRTLKRWLADPAFRALYKQARQQVMDRATAGLLALCNRATEALGRNLNCGHPAVEVRAAVAILEQAIRTIELTDLAERVASLEEQTAEQTHPVE
jgi:hypothetical protein